MKNDHILKARGIHKDFFHPKKVSVLKGIDLQVSPTETVAIVGPSGSGKSTLLHTLGTLEKPCQGSISFFDNQINGQLLSTIRNRYIGFVFQSGNLLEEYTLMDNLLIKAQIARRRCHKNSQSYRAALDLLERVGLTNRKDFLVKYLSGGENQRAAIARSMMNDPYLILADEPTGNLDNHSATNIQNLLISCCKEYQKALIVVTHDLHFANLCDRKLELQDGHLST